MDLKNPVLENDIVANLVWDSDKPLTFVVAGDFDLDGDGLIDYQSNEKVQALVERWGAKVDPAVNVNTNYIVLGVAPAVPHKPTYDRIAIDPLAMEKYESSKKRLADYQQVLKQAEALYVPIMNWERFLDFTGFSDEARTPGAFND